MKGNIRGLGILLIAVYFSVSDRERNIPMATEIEKIIENNSDETVGDFNGHIGFKGDYKLDDNGRMILE